MRFLNNDPKNKKPQDNKPQNGDDGRQGRRIIFLMVAALIATLLINSLYTTIANAYLSEITYNEFQTYLDKDEIAELEFQSDRMVILTRDEAKKPSSQQRLYYTGYIPNVSNDDLKDRLDAQGVEYNTEIVEQASPIVTFVVTWLLPVIIMYALFSLLMRGMTKRMGGGIGGIGESKAKVYMEKSTGITFADVAGQDEAKESLVEIIDFLHNPQKYAAIGAKLPKGALLVGPPGTGKTLLAKAVAGEASVPFFSISGSDFVEMFVGVGASRVRDLFQQAAKVAPAIIFIDEIDAIGRTRDSKFGGNDEREQTLNQLLAEIDGFDSSKGVVILAATNRPEILDKALLRAGRFDRRIIVDRPNLAGRYQTLRVHTKNIKLAEDVDLHKIAQATAGAVGADLANLVNEAALRAVRMGRKAVNQQDLLTSFELVIAGTEKKGTVLTDTEKRIVSYHEVGHALVAALQKHSQPVSKITIVPHTSGALGYTMQMPEEEKFLSSKEELIVELQTMLGGRAAEQVVFGIATTGASNDIERATELARKMVTEWGMSDAIGTLTIGETGEEVFIGREWVQNKNYSEDTARLVDAEVKRIVEEAHERCTKLLTENIDKLHRIAEALIERETISGEELDMLIEGKPLPPAEEHPASGKSGPKDGGTPSGSGADFAFEKPGDQEQAPEDGARPSGEDKGRNAGEPSADTSGPNQEQDEKK